MNLISDYWTDRKDVGLSIDDPLWHQVKDALSLIDGKNRTMIAVSANQHSQMIVAGGYDLRLLVNATLDGVIFFSLRNDVETKNKVVRFIGGQNGEYDASQFVEKSIAKKLCNTIINIRHCAQHCNGTEIKS